MKKITKILVALASIALVTGCRKINANNNNNNNVIDKPTKDQVTEAYNKMAALTNYTMETSYTVSSNDVDYEPIHYNFKMPVNSRYSAKIVEQHKEGASRSSQKMIEYHSDWNLNETLTYLNEQGMEVTMEQLLEYFNSYTAKANETYTINAQTGAALFEKDYSNAEEEVSYEIYDSSAKQNYRVEVDEGEFEFDDYIIEDDNDDSIMGLASIDDLFSKGTMDPKTGVLSYDAEDNVHFEVKFTISNGNFNTISMDVTTEEGKLAITVKLTDIGTTAFETPNCQPECRYDHNKAHTAVKYAKTEKGHRLVCADCNRYMDDGIEEHVLSHNHYGVCEKCGRVCGLSSEYADMQNEVVNKLAKFKTSEKAEYPYYYSTSYDYDKYSYGSDANNDYANFRYYAEERAIIVFKSSSQALLDDSCVEIQKYNHKFYLNLTDEQIAVVENDNNSWEATKAMLATLTPTKEIDSFCEGYMSHTAKDAEECLTVDLDSCHTETYITCAKCGITFSAERDTDHHDFEQTLRETVINSCVTKKETVCSGCGEVLFYDFVENHEHQHDVFCTLNELANYGIDATGYTPYYESSIFYFRYCDDCHMIGKYFNSSVYIYEMDATYVQPVNHTGYNAQAYQVRLDENGDGTYTLNDDCYGYSTTTSIPHQMVEGECALCGAKFYTLANPLDSLRVVENEEEGLQWTIIYKYDETETYDYESYASQIDSADHVVTYNARVYNDDYTLYLIKEYYDENDAKVIKVEVYNAETEELLVTVQ